MGGIATATIHLAIGLAKHFSKSEHQILVNEDKIFPGFDEEYTLPKNLSIVKLPTIGPKIYPISIKMGEYIEKFNPDVIYLKGIWRYTSFLAYNWKKQNPYKILILSPAGMLQKVPLQNKTILKKISTFFIEKKLFKLCDLIHAVSELEKEELIKSKLKFKKIIFIPEGIPGNNFIQEAKNSKKETSNKRLITISRIDPIKGLELLLESCQDIDFNGWQYFIYGNGEEKYINKIQRLIHKYNLTDKVKLHKGIFGDKKLKVLNESLAFILPSKSESFGICIAEAMLYGLPVITTTKTPWKIIKNNKLGWYIKPSKIELKKSLQELFRLPKNEIEEIGSRAKSYISKRYDLINTSKRMKKEIIELSGLKNKYF